MSAQLSSYHLDRERRRRRRESILIVITLVALIGFTTLEMRLSTLSSELPLAHNIFFFGLININVILLMLLVFLVFRNLVKLLLEWKRGVLGAKLQAKLVCAFLAFTIIPLTILSFVLFRTVGNRIEWWFNRKVERTLKHAVQVSQTYYNDILERTKADAEALAYLLRDDHMALMSAVDSQVPFDQHLKRFDIQQIYVFGADQRLMMSFPEAMSDHAASLFKQSVAQEPAHPQRGVFVEEDQIYAFVPVTLNNQQGLSQDLWIGVVRTMPGHLAGAMKGISLTYAGFRDINAYINPIHSSYFIMLGSMILLIIFSATWLGLHLAKRITVPLQELSKGTRQVAHGNLDYHVKSTTKDELGVLADSFNQMTHDLKHSKLNLEQANQNLQSSNQELGARHQYIETILKHVAAGVISLDSSGHITTINDSAARLLQLNPEEVVGQTYHVLLERFEFNESDEFIDMLTQNSGNTARRPIHIMVGETMLTLLVHVSFLKDEQGQNVGIVAVFDDLTHLIKVQRVAAWREVAKRIAHEIKNPLTPIKLSAQRLRKRYMSASPVPDDMQLLDECTHMIVQQVDELKQLVDEFSRFARMPASNPVPEDLNQVIRDACALYSQDHADIHFAIELDEALPAVPLDKEQFKRVLINLLDNAVASIQQYQHDHPDDKEQHRISLASIRDKAAEVVRLKLSDSGLGFSPKIKAQLFEPYFSTKDSGTGLGLTIVRQIIADHHGYIRANDIKPHGAEFIIELPLGSYDGVVIESASFARTESSEDIGRIIS